MKTFKEFLEVKGIKKEDFDGYKADKQAELLNEFNTEQKAELTAIAAKIEKAANSEDLEALKAEHTELKKKFAESVDTQIEILKNAVIDLQKKAKSEPDPTQRKALSFTDQVKKGLKANVDNLKSLKERSQGNGFALEVKGLTLKEISLGSFTGGNVPVEQRLPGFGDAPSRRVRLLDLIQSGTAESNLITWVYEVSQLGAVGGTLEGELKNELEMAWAVAGLPVVKRTGFMKVTTEVLEDIGQMSTMITNRLRRDLLKDAEEQVYGGNGTAPNLLGLKSIASPIVIGSEFAATVDNPNEIDVLVVAMDNVMENLQEDPNFIMVHHSVVTALKLVKRSTTDKAYIDRLQFVAGQLQLDGVPIIPVHSSLEADKDIFLIGNGSLATLYDKGEISIEIGFDGNDLTTNKRTIVAEWRGALVVEHNERSAFITGSFAAAKAALLKV